MFSSLFQLQQTPVTVFRSTDDNAPHLTNAAGSLKTILKSCLVTGYGTKTALGWDMPFESTDGKSAVFKSADATSSRYCLKVDNSTSAAILSSYKEMTDINTGSGQWGGNIYDTQTSDWILIGHGKSFVFLVDITFASKKHAYPVIFGDLPSETKRLLPVCLLWSGRKLVGANSAGVQTAFFGTPNGYNVNGNYHLLNSQVSYPFAVSSGSSSENLVSNTCRFNHASDLKASLIYEPVLSSLRDSTWTFLPMLMPMSSKMSSMNNLSLIGPNSLKVVTGSEEYFNNSCAVQTDWWWS